MRFVNVNGVLQRARRFISAGPGNIQEEEVKNPSKLVEVLRGIQKRVSDIEVVLPPEGIEFEVNVSSGGALVKLAHNFNGPIRWYVVQWLQTGGSAYPTSGPDLVHDASSDSRNLYLRSYIPGRAIIRVEQSFVDVDPGITVASSPDRVSICLANNFTTTSQTAVSTPLTFPMKAGEVWRIHYVGMAMDSAVGGMRYQMGAPVGSTMDGWHYGNGGALATRLYAQVSTVNVLYGTFHTVANVTTDDQILITVKAAINGNFTIQCATVTAATTVTIFAKSSLVAQKMSEV